MGIAWAWQSNKGMACRAFNNKNHNKDTNKGNNNILGLRKVADVSCMLLCQAGSAGAVKGKLQPARRWGASYWTQIHILFARAVKTRRFESLSSQDFAQFVIVGVLSGGDSFFLLLLFSASLICMPLLLPSFHTMFSLL